MKYNLNWKPYFCICSMIFLAFFVIHSAGSAFAAEETFYNYNTNSMEQYNGRQITYTYNNKTLSLDNPGMILNDIALADAEGLFAEQLGLTVSYNRHLNQIAISDGKNTILMEPGNKTAYVNGEAKIMNALPIRLRFEGAETDLIYVPTRFVCQNLGYTYVWTSSTSTVKITKTLKLEIDSKDVNYIGTFYSIKYMNQSVDLGQLPIIIYNGSLLVRAQKLCEATGCTFMQNGEQITITKDNINILFTLNSNIAYVNGKKIKLESGMPCNIINRETLVSYICIPFEFFSEYLGFDVLYDDAEKQYNLLLCDRTGNPDRIDALKNYTETNMGTTQVPVSKDDYYFEWNCLPAYEEVLENRANATHYIYTGKTSEEVGLIYLLYSKISETDSVEQFRFATTDAFQTIDTMETEHGLQILISHADTATHGTVSVDYAIVDSYSILSDKEKEQVTIELELKRKAGEYEYSIELNESGTELSIFVYPKYLTRVVAYPMNGTDVLELHGLQSTDIHDFFDNGMLIFELSATYNCVDTQYYYNEDNPYFKYGYLTGVTDKTKLQLQLSEGHAYYIVEKDNAVLIYFTDASVSLEEMLKNLQKPGVELPKDKLIIPLPDDCTIADVSDDDNYLNYNFKLLIKGNQKDLILQKGITNPYSFIEDYTVTYNKTTNYTTISFDTEYVCGYKYEIFENYLVVTIGRPSEIFSKIVLLDAGHGGVDPGAIYNKTYEKTLNFKILNTYVKDYFTGSDIKVYFTRETDVLVDLYKRADYAKEVEADLFISLHMNANNSTSVKGTQVFYSKNNNTKQTSGLSSYLLAKQMVKNLCSSMGTNNRGVSAADFVVVKYNTVPAILIELGFMSNASDYAKLTDINYQKKAAKTIYETVEQIFKTYPTGR